MTAADHANTVRKALRRTGRAGEALAALDALQAQAEAAAQVADERNQFYDRLNAAEAVNTWLREALRDAALLNHERMLHPRLLDVCTWPECRKARAALYRSERAEAAEADRDEYKREFDKVMERALNCISAARSLTG